MADTPRKEVPEWLAALRHPKGGDLYLSPYIVAPDHVRDVLQAFGKRPTFTKRFLVAAIDEMAARLWFAHKHKPSFSFDAGQNKLKALAAAAKNLRNKLQDGELRRAIFRANTLKWPIPDYRDRPGAEELPPIFAEVEEGLAFLIKGAASLENRKIYNLAFDQPPDSQKSLERALLWEPLLKLLDDFHEDYGAHQPLIATIRSLHLACGIEPPDPGAVRQTVNAWRKRQR
jgi:hypothetical protein